MADATHRLVLKRGRPRHTALVRVQQARGKLVTVQESKNSVYALRGFAGAVHGVARNSVNDVCMIYVRKTGSFDIGFDGFVETRHRVCTLQGGIWTLFLPFTVLKYHGKLLQLVSQTQASVIPATRLWIAAAKPSDVFIQMCWSSS